MGAFFAVSPFAGREGLDEAKLFDGIRTQLRKKFGKLGDRVVEDNLRVIRRGYDEVKTVTPGEVVEDVTRELATANIPRLLDLAKAQQGVGNPGRFWEQVCSVSPSRPSAPSRRPAAPSAT
jgi:pyruvate-ferredoxin/flavodoxin oxidoreductase